MMDMNKRIERYHEMMNTIEHPDGFTDWLVETGFFTSPASTKFHGAYEGGLFDHSCEVALELAHITERLPLIWENPRSPFLVGMFHDLCKADHYIKLENGGEISFKVNKDPSLAGHGERSVTLLSKWFTLTDEEKLCILHHMGAYDRQWAAYDKAIRQYPNVLWTHTADMFASKVKNV